MIEDTYKIWDERDFPFYDKNPYMTKYGWLMLFTSIILSFIAYAIISEYSEILGSIVFAFIMLITLLYLTHWNYNLIFYKVSKEELFLAVLMFIFYLIYAMVMISVIGLAGGESGNPSPITVTSETIISLIFSVLGEELIKFIPLMFFMRLFYKISGKKRLSLALSSIIILIGFGLLHYTSDTTIIMVLLIQGAGTIFELYGYYKTKNLFVPYMSHLFTDMFLMFLMLL